MQSYKSWRNPAKAASILSNFFSALRVCMFLLIFLLSGPISGDNEKWIPYTTGKHYEGGRNNDFARRVYSYLLQEKNLSDSDLTEAFNRWYRINLGHVFEEVALEAYGVPKNKSMFNRRIPDGVEDGILEQLAQYTVYQNSTFIEVKYMQEISLKDKRIRGQITDMIDYLSRQESRSTTRRSFTSAIFPNPGKASEEELAILVFVTASNTTIGEDIIDYANDHHVKIYQQKMMTNYFNQIEVKLSKAIALTKPSRHLFGHTFFPKKAIVNWQKLIIDPDNGQPIYGY